MDSYYDIWKLMKEYCRNKISEAAYTIWINPLQPVSFENDKLTMRAENKFKAELVIEKFMELLEEAFEKTMGFKVAVEIIYDSSKNDELKLKKENISLQEEDTKYELNFENFIVGSSNTFAHAAALAVAENPGKTWNPLFIYGNSGLGKTHLLNAICIHIKKNNPDINIIYTSGENFTNDLILSLEKNKMEEFHNKYRNADILLIDDIQFIAGKTRTQEEFFHTFNTLNDREGTQIVLTSDRSPKEIATLEDRIRTRFEAGLLADIQPPDIETRIAIIRRKAALMDLNLSDEIVQYIAEKIKFNIRQLEGAVKKINALCILNGHEPSIISTQKAIRDILPDNQPLPVTIDKIINEVARTFGTTAENITSNKRNDKIVKSRQTAMYIIREITSLPYDKIGEHFGNKDHSTVLYSINQVEEKLKSNSEFKATLDGIINNIKGEN